MPRSRSTKFTPKSAPRFVPAPAPVQSHSMFDTMKKGFSFGIGSSIAHRLFDPSPHRNENIPKNESNPRNENIPKNDVSPKNDVIPNNESKLTVCEYVVPL